MRVIGLLAVLVLIGFGAYALHDAARRPTVITGDYAAGPDVVDLKNPAVEALIAQTLREKFGTPQEARFPAEAAKLLFRVPDGEPFAQHLEFAVRTYRLRCLHCHGLSGDGNGPTAPFLLPRPRDFRKGIFKFTSTSTGEKPTRDDLRRTLHHGVPGTVMPSFALADAKEDNDTEIEAVIDYVLLLACRGQMESLLVKRVKDGEELTAASIGDAFQEDFDFVIGQWKRAESKVVKPDAPKPKEVTRKSIEEGRNLFLVHTAKCFECHGPDGTGRTPSTIDEKTGETLKKDDWGNPILPADLTQGIYRGGRRPIDLYRRIHSGIKGTPMPGFAGTLKAEQIWDLVHYVQWVGGMHRNVLPASP